MSVTRETLGSWRGPKVALLFSGSYLGKLAKFGEERLAAFAPMSVILQSCVTHEKRMFERSDHLSNPAEWLHEAAQGLKQFGHVENLLGKRHDQDFWMPNLFKYGHVSLKDALVTGFEEPNANAIIKLAQEIQRNNGEIARGARRSDVAGKIALSIRDHYNNLGDEQACAEKWPAIREEIVAWFEREAINITHYIPCILIPDYAESFSVGPVSFIHIHDILTCSHGLSHASLPKFNCDALRQALDESSACWVAVVEVTKCLDDRSLELANLAVDVAIGALKLVVSHKSGSGMARATARTLSRWHGSVAVYEPECAKGPAQRAAGNLIDGRTFTADISSAQVFLSNAGISISAFLSGQDRLRKLRQAWCDSAYWYHEGTAEALATVAVVKLETAIEALLRASSSHGSAERIKYIIKTLTGLNSSDRVPGPVEKTVHAFVKDLVTARSRILHGTISPLIDDIGEERGHLIWLARKLLLNLTAAIEEFSAETNAVDDMEKFLKWLADRHATKKQARTP